ncbi:MAG: citramalate synthase [Phycisphaerae bacterium]|nr:citramalate synthase [Phycisphaerae bacterium]
MNTNDTNRRVEVYDTTLRDGTQAQGVSLSVKDKLEIAALLDSLGVDYIEGGYPLSNPKDAAFFEQVKTLDLKHTKIAAFGMTRRKGIGAADDTGMQALLKSEATAITIVGKTWDLHVREVLRVNEDENLAMIADSVKIMADDGREAIYDAEHFFDGWRANPDYALKTLQAAVDAGATCLVLCDTNGGSLPEQIVDILGQARAALPNARFGIHCHNDGELAVANTVAAVTAGAVQVQGTINGIGERCGNVDLVSVVANLSLKYGYDILGEGAVEKLTDLSRHVYELANLNIREHQPFVGPSAFAHKGGMHVHAVQRNVSTYEHIDPARVGNKRRILVSELGGRSNIAAAVGAKFNVADDREAQAKILERVMEMEHEGYQFEEAEASFEMLVRKTLGDGWYRQLWALDHYRCVILKTDGGEPSTEAIVKLQVDGETRHTVAEGDGPVDSLVQAMRFALTENHRGLEDLHLMDYRVRVVNTQAETAAKVRVVIDWRDAASDAFFGSVGVSENIIEASWQAVSDAIEYKLLGDMES